LQIRVLKQKQYKYTTIKTHKVNNNNKLKVTYFPQKVHSKWEKNILLNMRWTKKLIYKRANGICT